MSMAPNKRKKAQDAGSEGRRTSVKKESGGAAAVAVKEEEEEEEDVAYIDQTLKVAAALRANRGFFEARVFRVVAAIPKGKVASYGQCAALAGAPKNARQVGKLLADGLACGLAPWQRVINSAGSISLPAQYGGNTQRALLKSEGVEFQPSGKVTRSSFWIPTDEEKDCLFSDL